VGGLSEVKNLKVPATNGITTSAYGLLAMNMKAIVQRSLLIQLIAFHPLLCPKGHEGLYKKKSGVRIRNPEVRIHVITQSEAFWLLDSEFFFI